MMGMRRTVGIVGNPNCGKTTLFNRLTGSRQRVGNWPGVTVERKEGSWQAPGGRIQVVDLPGIYSLAAQSTDEKVARDYLLSQDANLFINILDASNLERNLYLTVQLMEMRVPLVVVLNMMDVATERGMRIDLERLSKRLGCPVIPMMAKRGDGIDRLLESVEARLGDGLIGLPAPVPFPTAIHDAVSVLTSRLEGSPRASESGANLRWTALKLVEGDGGGPTPWWNAEVEADAATVRLSLEKAEGEEPDILIADARYEIIGELTSEIIHRTGEATHALTERLDRIVLNRFLGIPIFLGVLYLMFMFTINLGGAFIDFFDILFGAIFVDGFRTLLEGVGMPGWLTTLLADGMGGAIQTLATFIPPIGFMFLFLSWLEDSGYMARAAFIMDRFLLFLGLPGKAFIPMMVGFGCNVPAIMGARTLENDRDRTLTIMMNPFMSCGARMPVYALFVAAFFPVAGQNIVFGLYLIGVVFAVLTGLVLKNSLLKGDPVPFVMELPVYHLPTLRSVIQRAWERLLGFILRASRFLIPAIMVLSFLNSVGTDGSYGNQDSEKSVLSAVSRTITPIFEPMGLTEENWPATVGIFTGVFAKEAVVGTLDALYGQMAAEQEGGEEGEGGGLVDSIAEAFGSIWANLSELSGALGDPLGVGLEETASLEEAAGAQEVSMGTFGAMAALFDGVAGAFAYLLFILLYFPCVAATAAIYHETNLRWTLFASFWTTGIAWSAATLFYQAATWARHPAQTLGWILSIILFWVAVYLVMRLRFKDRREADHGGRFAYEEV